MHDGRIRIGTCKHRKGIYVIKGKHFDSDVGDYVIDTPTVCNCGDRSCYAEVSRLRLEKAVKTGDLYW